MSRTSCLFPRSTHSLVCPLSPLGRRGSGTRLLTCPGESCSLLGSSPALEPPGLSLLRLFFPRPYQLSFLPLALACLALWELLSSRAGAGQGCCVWRVCWSGLRDALILRVAAGSCFALGPRRCHPPLQSAVSVSEGVLRSLVGSRCLNPGQAWGPLPRGAEGRPCIYIVPATSCLVRGLCEWIICFPWKEWTSCIAARSQLGRPVPGEPDVPGMCIPDEYGQKSLSGQRKGQRGFLFPWKGLAGDVGSHSLRDS